MMIRWGVQMGVWLALVLGWGVPGWAGEPYGGPDDPRAVRAARVAADALGAGAGARSVAGRVVEIVGDEGVAIVGLRSVDYGGGSREIAVTLKDLGARQVGTEIQVSLSGDVLFDFDRWEIRAAAQQQLAALLQLIRKLKKRHVIIEGHTDAKGSDAYNRTLSLKRAEAVRRWFFANGLPGGVRVEARGYGESRPVAANVRADGSDNPEGRAANRRVEIRIWE